MDRIHPSKQPNRPHFIQAWAVFRGYKKAAALAKELGTDKSLVSRWYKGSTPSLDYQERLAALFHIERESLFRDPAEDWFSRFFADRQADELERMKAVLEAGFPRKKAG